MGGTQPYIDLHTHRPSTDDGVVSVTSLEIEQLPQYAHLPRWCTVGRHPWHAAAEWGGAQSQALDDALGRKECIALGEVGLDRARGPAFPRQLEVLEAQLDIAEYHQLPVVFHCVRAHADLLQLRKRRKATQPWIIHGFAGHGELAGQLLRMDFHLSFGAALLSTGAKAREALTQMPLHRLFLESDESGLDMALLYRTASDVLGCPVEELRRVIAGNFREVFQVEDP